jgi:hypothetical protein
MARLFITTREIDFVSDITKEIIKDVIGQKIYYYNISLIKSKVHDLYAEAPDKIVEMPVVVDCRVKWMSPEIRTNNFGTEEIYIKDLMDWANDVVAPLATQAWFGRGEFVPGEHCTSCFCKARYTCPARAAQAVAIAQQEFGPLEDAQPPLPESLSMARVAELLPKADMVIDWFNDLKAYALKQATEHNTIVPGYKMVEGRSNRKYSDQDAVAAKLVASGVPEEVIYGRSLLGITAMEKAVGKKVFAEVLDGLIVKPEGKPTLVPVSDKRPALASAASAVEDFS